MQRYGEFILKYPRLIIFGLIAVAMLAVYPAMNIRTDFNLEGFYPDDDEVIRDYERLENEFGRDDNSILLGFQTDSLFSEGVIADLIELTGKLKSIAHIDNVFSIIEAQKIEQLNDQLTFSPYINTDDLSENSWPDIKASLTDNPLFTGLLINKEGTATAIIITIDDEENTYTNRNEIIRSIDEILAEYEGNYQFHKSGIPYYRNQYVNMLNSEIVMYIAISSILIILLLWYLYRTIWGVLFPMIIVWTTLLFTVALMQLTGGYLEIMSSTIAPILLCVGVADAIHMISKYDDAREKGLVKSKSIIEMLNTLGNATLLTSVTTAIGFASLISSTVMPMKKFGLYTAVGVILAYLITILFLPAALRLSKKKRVIDEKSGSFYPFINKWLTKLAALNRMHYKKVLIGGAALTLIFFYGMQTLDVNGRIFDDLKDDTRIMQDSRFFAETIAPQFPMEFIIDTGEPELALTYSVLHKLEQLEEKLIAYPEIHRATGMHTLIKEVHRVMSDEGIFELPQSDQAIAQYALLLEINDFDELYNFVDFDYRTLRVTAFTEDAGSKRINEIRSEIDFQLAEIFELEEVIVTGTTILSADLTNKIVYSLAWSILLALTAITLIMVGLFKNIKLVIIALVPNLVPLIMVGGIMGFLNVDIKPSTAVIFTIALGIAVDDSIHYLARFRIEYMRRKAMMPAITATTVKTGRAIILTSLILIAGFGTLITSAFTSTAMMGILVCTTIFSALIADLFMLPSLFYWLKPKLPIVDSPR
ncbi:MAG: MMPL family transporter [Balneolaceae bacterium]|nr:MMPL family transporter [Balneolaceae bacterium]